MAARTAPDYYATLGVERTADARAIKEAFRKLALRHHPDRSREPEAAERFKAIAEAYAVLGDPEKRAAYDARGRAAEAYAPEDLFRGADFGEWFGPTGFGVDWVERLFGGTPFRRDRGQDLETRLVVSLERIAHGGEERVAFERPASCPACAGTGYRPETPAAAGAAVGRTRCRTCRGGGAVFSKDSVTITLPPGLDEDTLLRVAGKGVAAVGRRPGDLLVLVSTRADPRFGRRGADLVTRVTIGVADAALGTELEVAALDGPVRLRVPAGTQPFTVLRLRGEGLPRMGSRTRGDLLVTVEVRVPERLSPAARRAFEALKQLPR